MEAKVEHNAAVNLLKERVQFIDPKVMPGHALSNLISLVIMGDHLTYRYILMTGLLAKATNLDANPLVLQAGSQLEGAYDARSLCHKVIVPLEAELLDGRLGKSNEPFLNKPARFRELSATNAVRKGKDAETLRTLLKIFNSPELEADAVGALDAALFWTMQRPAKAIKAIDDAIAAQEHASDVMAVVRNILTQGHEGEVMALLSAAAVRHLVGNELTVLAHPVNQAGSSSNEIGDIDVRDDERPIFSVEVKDKVFTDADADHAIGKAFDVGVMRYMFIYRDHTQVDADMSAVTRKWEERGLVVSFKEIGTLYRDAIVLAGPISIKKLAESISEMITYLRPKDGTLRHINNCFQAVQLVAS